MTRSGTRQPPRVRDFAAGDWSHEGRLDRRDSGRVSIEHRELDFEGRAVRVDVYNGADVASFQAPVWDWRRENDPAVLSDHAGATLTLALRPWTVRAVRMPDPCCREAHGRFARFRPLRGSTRDASRR